VNGSLPIGLAHMELEPLPFAEAIEFWQGKVAMEPKDFYALAAECRAKAFTVTGVARMDMIEDVQAGIDAALEQGITLRDFKKMVGDIGLPEYRMDTIFTTNVQGAYNTGRIKQQTDPDVLARRPYWQFLHTPGQKNPRPDHEAHDGEVYRADDPFWDVWYPHQGSLGNWYNCKCRVRTLSDFELEELGVEVQPPTGAPRDPGELAKKTWEPDLDKYPDDLRKRFEDERARRAT
jgi:uncharacterized protein with gpF-like domain